MAQWRKPRPLAVSVQAGIYDNELERLVEDAWRGVGQVKEIASTLRTLSACPVHELPSSEVDVHGCIDMALAAVCDRSGSSPRVVRRYSDIPEVSCNPPLLHLVLTDLLINVLEASEGRDEVLLTTFERDAHAVVSIECLMPGGEAGRCSDGEFAVSRAVLSHFGGHMDFEPYRAGRGAVRVHLPLPPREGMARHRH